MQFSVIVEGNAKIRGPGDESWEELERYLHTAKIPAKLIKQLQPGKAQVLKKQLSYEQAVLINDRLMDLGLESIIDPPIKPDADKGKGSAVLRSVKGSTGPGKEGVQSARRRTGTGNRASTRPRAASPAEARSADRPRLRTAPVQESASPTLARAAAEIKALFHLPRGGKLDITLPRASRLRVWSLCALSLLVPTLLITAFGALAAATVVTIVGLYSFLASFSPLLGIVLLPLPVLAVLTAGILLAIPFGPGPRQAESRQDKETLPITSRDEPRLVMLTTAICKVIDAPAPSAIHLQSAPLVRGRLDCSARDFFTLGKPLPGKSRLFLGAPVLACLTVSDLASLIARECGRFAQPQFDRPYMLSMSILTWLQSCAQRPRLSKRLRRAIADRGRKDLQVHLDAALRRMDQLQTPSYRVINLCEKYLSWLIDGADAVAGRYQTAILGSRDLARLRQTLADTKAAHEDAVATVLANEPPRQLVDSLSALSRKLLHENVRPDPRAEVLPGIVQSSKPGSTLVTQFAAYDKQLTRRFYENHGIKLDSLDLRSLDEIQRREANAAKLRRIAHHYYVKWFHSMQFWQLPADDLLDGIDEKVLVSRLNQCIGRVRYLSPDRPQILAKYYKLSKHLVELKAAKKVTASGIPFSFQYCADASNNLDKEISVRAIKLREFGEDLRQQNAVMGERLALGLALDKQHRSTTRKLHVALNTIHGVSGKLNQLSADIDELSVLQNYQRKKLPQHYRLHIKELNERIEGSYKMIRRKLQQCPYGFYDRRYPTVGALLEHRLEQEIDSDAGSTPSAKATILLDTVTQAYEGSSDLAASYAARMEARYKVETIKRV